MESQKNTTSKRQPLLARFFLSLGRWLEKQQVGEDELPEWTPHVNNIETHNAFLIIVVLPHASKESIVVNRKGDVLKVKGERKPGSLRKHSRHKEDIPMDNGKFRLVFPLSSEVDRSQIDATYANGLLTIRMPKISTSKPEGFQIDVN